MVRSLRLWLRSAILRTAVEGRLSPQVLLQELLDGIVGFLLFPEERREEVEPVRHPLANEQLDAFVSRLLQFRGEGASAVDYGVGGPDDEDRRGKPRRSACTGLTWGWDRSSYLTYAPRMNPAKAAS